METHPLSRRWQQMLEDCHWSANAPEVQCPQHYGKFVVIRNKQVLGSGTDRMALIKEVAEREKIPWQDLLVVIVPRPDIFEEIPH